MEAAALTARLERGGFVAAAEEAGELLAAAAGDAVALERMVARRETGEPLGWITGTTTFCGLALAVHPGVYVPRRQTEALAERAAARLPARAVDQARGVLRPGGALLLELGGDQAIALDLTGYADVERIVDEDSDVRGIEAVRSRA